MSFSAGSSTNFTYACLSQTFIFEFCKLTLELHLNLKHQQTS